ncbi:MAG TPA: Smr/MutS family protein [Vicinamibacteria bacterium]|nr:Smr/MutS family protein [Vicinamibacteria bacterium]
MNVNSLKALEFDSIRALLLQHAGSAQGTARVAQLSPLADVAAVREALARTSEGVVLLRALGRQPYHDLPDPEEALVVARTRGAHLEPRALADLASFIEGGVEIAWRVARVEGAPRLATLASAVRDTREVARSVRRALLPSGEVADDASPRLADLRRTLVRLKSQLTSVMEGYLRSRDAERLLQDRVITTRNDRYVLLLKAEQKGQLPGIIHGSSGSGASLFVEPLPAVELNNDIVSLQDEERAEVLRILQELTAGAGARAEDIAQLAFVLGQLDAVQAMALLALDMDAQAPLIVSENDGIELHDSRHPLLMPALAARLGIERGSEPVPVSIRVGGDEPVLVISGPNTGGKTVALKTVGLFAAMAQCGLHVPAASGSRLPVFARIFADIGDEQSIAENLSTFSSHLSAIVAMTRDLARPALVLLDEVGAGTDPTEGGALGVAIVEHFRRQGAVVIATTHHGLMKAYAQSTPGVACASFGYDPHSYEPTFRLSLGTPGRSLALEMAERLGLPAEVVRDARSRRDLKEEQAEALLQRLEQEKAELERERVRLEGQKAEAEGARLRALADEREMQSRKRREVEVFARELRRRGEEAEARATEAIREAVERLEAAQKAAALSPRVRSEAVRAIREAREGILRDPQLAIPAEPEPEEVKLAVGSRVRVRAAAGVTGEVMALKGDLAEVAVSGKRLQVPTAELIGLARSAAVPRGVRGDGGPPEQRTPGRSGRSGATPVHPRPSSNVTVSFETKSVPAEVNLIGLTVEQAQDRVDKLLDDAALSDRREIRIVHGFGEGKLRKAIARMLERHPLVASYRPGGPNEGGGGATVVELKD